MPYHWIRVSTGTPERLKQYADDAEAFDRELGAIAEECGGALERTFFDRNDRYAYGLVHVVRESLDVAKLEELLSDERGKPMRVDLETAEERARRNPKA